MSDEQLFRIPFYHYGQNVFAQIRERVAKLSDDQLSDEETFINSMVSKHRLAELSIDWDSLVTLPNPREEESFSRDIFGDQQRTVTPVYTFEVKFSGSPVLFTISPSTSRMIHLEAEVEQDKLSFEIKGSDKSRLEQIKGGIQENVGNQKQEVANFNSELEGAVRHAVEQRKQELQKHSDGLNAFGVPVKETED